MIDQWCVQNIFQALDHAGDVYVYSAGLTDDQVRNVGGTKVDDLQAAVTRLITPRSKVVVVPDGPYVVGKVK